jgi:hypothetical protein
MVGQFEQKLPGLKPRICFWSVFGMAIGSCQRNVLAPSLRDCGILTCSPPHAEARGYRPLRLRRDCQDVPFAAVKKAMP